MEFDLREHYSLLQALDEVGRVLYPQSWTGLEPWAAYSDDPKERAAEKAKVSERAKAAEALVEQARRDLRYAANEEEKAGAQERHDAAYKIFRREESCYQQFPTSFDSWQVNHDAWKRRLHAEGKLFEAFSARELMLLYRVDNEIPWDSWINQKGFRTYSNLSTVRVPHYVRSGPVVGDARDKSVSAEKPRRDPYRHAVFVRIDAFETWLYRHKWADAAFKNLPPEDQCRVVLVVLAAETPPNKKRLRGECEALCMTVTPDLAKNAFRKIWENTVPETWRTGGRPPEETVLHVSPNFWPPGKDIL